MTNRVHIDAPAGVIDIEGEKDFVEGLLAKLFPLVEEAGFGSRPQGLVNDQDIEDSRSATDEVALAVDNGKAGGNRAKRKRNIAPKGHTCTDRILTLKDEGFFKTKRGLSDIVAGLSQKGFTHQSNQVAAAGESLFKRSLLQRTKEGKGPFMYFWDRD